MKLAVSNIAWPIEDEKEAAKILTSHEIKAVEVAPTKMWPNLLDAQRSQLQSYRQFWSSYGIEIVAMQALLFGRPELTIFEDEHTRKQTSNYLKRVIEIGSELGASTLVFGSPKNRKRGFLQIEDANEIAAVFFKDLGEYAYSLGSALCIEANPVQYGCDFITNSVEAAELVKLVDSKGFGLHIDCGTMFLTKENPESILRTYNNQIRHLHFSAPQLEPLHLHEELPFGAIRDLLDKLNYQNFASIEMASAADALAAVNSSINHLRETQA